MCRRLLVRVCRRLGAKIRPLKYAFGACFNSLGYRFRLHRKDLPGSPDIVFPRHHKIILVHGCFWHGHEQCKRAKRPENNAETWRLKIASNQFRDTRNVNELHALGWGVLVVWECEVQDQMRLTQRVLDFMQSD